jgi:hypothetical protein
MPRVGFEPTIPVFERANTFRALDRVANAIGLILSSVTKFSPNYWSWMETSETAKYLIFEKCSNMLLDHRVTKCLHVHLLK